MGRLSENWAASCDSRHLIKRLSLLSWNQTNNGVNNSASPFATHQIKRRILNFVFQYPVKLLPQVSYKCCNLEENKEESRKKK